MSNDNLINKCLKDFGISLHRYNNMNLQELKDITAFIIYYFSCHIANNKLCKSRSILIDFKNN